MATRRTFLETRLSRAVFAMLVVVFLMWWQPRFLFQPLSTVLHVLMAPIAGVLSGPAYALSEVGHDIASLRTLKDENERLYEENLSLRSRIALGEDILVENNLLRSEVGLLPRGTFDLVAARVSASDVSTFGHWVDIDHGSTEGIREGMAVIVSDGVLVGKVDRVFPWSARVMLLSHPDSSLPVRTSQSNIQGLARGEFGIGVILDMVMRSEPLREGDTMVTSGLRSEVPEGLLVGTVSTLRESPDRLFQQATVTLPVRPDQLRFVFVIRGVQS